LHLPELKIILGELLRNRETERGSKAEWRVAGGRGAWERHIDETNLRLDS
jgi:hypothetical protein